MAVVVALVDDLMFLSRIREAAKGRGVEVKAVRTAAGALAAAHAGAGLVGVDLDSPRLPWAGGADGLRAGGRSGGGDGRWLASPATRGPSAGETRWRRAARPSCLGARSCSSWTDCWRRRPPEGPLPPIRSNPRCGASADLSAPSGASS